MENRNTLRQVRSQFAIIRFVSEDTTARPYALASHCNVIIPNALYIKTYLILRRVTIMLYNVTESNRKDRRFQ